MVYQAARKSKTLPTIAELKKAPREKHIPGFNYCCPATLYRTRKSGKYEQMMTAAGKKLVGTKPYGKPANKLDKFCMAHDKVFSNPSASAAQVRKSDNALIAGAKTVAHDKTQPKKLRLQAVAVAKGIGAKVGLEKIGLVREGSFASGGAKDSKLSRGAKRIFRAITGKKEPTLIMKGLAKRRSVEPENRPVPSKDTPNYNEDVNTVKLRQRIKR